ncbi:Transposon Ty3-I Gag-Pol polyprotein [Labeo rohita]|uniref:Transposon Ty3-I Gag-Pol polyprotein n=1 Tax=Labeo rohita TaxID=84645 RepID=A0ABQ8L2L3_LABRO|nr:Transposon Ty3-I Gag-Pol polyprotein [Labeo rohita]
MYQKGRCNVVPDSLSRAIPEEKPLGCIAVCKAKDVNGDLPINWQELGQSQKGDQSLQTLWDEAKLHPVDPQHIHYVVQNDFLFRCIPDGQKGHALQVIIPKDLRQQFLHFAHDNPLSGHLGCMKTLRRLLIVVYWPEIQQDVWDYCKRCQSCQQYKPRIPKLSGTLKSTPVKEPGYMVGIHLMGPFPRSTKLNEYLLVTVDYCSKPRTTVSQLLNATCRQWGAIQKLTTTYYPQTNLTEGVNRVFVKDNHWNWDQWIRDFRFAINSSWQESTNYTPTEVALGRKLKGPLELLQYHSPDPDQSAYEVIECQQSLLERVKGNVAKAQSRQQIYYNWFGFMLTRCLVQGIPLQPS